MKDLMRHELRAPKTVDRATFQEDWLRQREQLGSPPTLEELRAKGREDWPKLRVQQTREGSRDPQDRSAETDRGAEPKDLPRRPHKGLDDDLSK